MPILFSRGLRCMSVCLKIINNLIINFVMKKRLLIVCSLLLLGQAAKAQVVLQRYVDSALTNNIVLQQKNISLHRAEYALQTAKGMFWPSVDIMASYKTADGGRNIPLPLGDLLNGAYATLNQLTQSHEFPQLENQSINFLPQNFYDAKVRVSVPIINAEMVYNKQLNAKKVQLSQYEVAIYKRELVKDVKTAYYHYLQALDGAKIYQSAVELAQESKRVNQKLLDNGKGLPAYVLRAKSKVQAAKAELIEARQQVDNARRYFNFLLNRDQKASIDTLKGLEQAQTKVMKLLGQTPDISQREELQALTTAVDLRVTVQKMKKSAYYPSLNGFVDLGSQSENWQFNEQSRYYMVGLQLKIPLFSGNQNRYKVKSAQLAVETAQLELERAMAQMDMQSQMAKNQLQSAYQRFLASKKQLESAATYQRLIHRGYRAGVNSYIETIDAQTQLTKARQAVSINRFKMLAALAQLERATAAFNLD